MITSRQRTLITILIVIGGVIVGFFGLRAFRALNQVREHRPPPPFAPEAAPVETDVELIRDWMTISYISRIYDVPSKILFNALGIPSRGNEEKSLAQLNERYSPEIPGIVVEVVKATILIRQPTLFPESHKTPLDTVTSTPSQP
jgi:hypothetical protein